MDVREEDPHAQEHPLFAANFPLSRIEVDALSKLPRKDVPIVTLDDGQGDAQLATKNFLRSAMLMLLYLTVVLRLE